MALEEDDAILPYMVPARACRIVKAAEESGMSDAQIAVALSVSVSAPKMWAAGKVMVIRPPTARKLRRLERRLEKNGRAK